LVLPQNPNNLFFRKPLPLHRLVLLQGARLQFSLDKTAGATSVRLQHSHPIWTSYCCTSVHSLRAYLYSRRGRLADLAQALLGVNNVQAEGGSDPEHTLIGEQSGCSAGMNENNVSVG